MSPNDQITTRHTNGEHVALVKQAQQAVCTTFDNMGSATPVPVRQAHHLTGLTPAAVESIEAQRERALAHLRRQSEPLNKYVFLSNLRNTNEICPLIYTPTVGTACLEYSNVYPFLAASGTPDGLFLRAEDLPNLGQILDNYRAALPDDPQICVITDGSRILGLGDLGVNGMGIPVGKLQLYVAAAGLDPRRVLPICLDLGTNTQRYLDDALYMGVRHKRPEDDQFYPIVAEVLASLNRRFPRMLIQFEDFSSEHAFELLDRHRNQYLSFNDDIQGTGAVVLSGFINAIEQVGRPISEHRVLFFGAGSAGVGVAKQLAEHFRAAGGLSEEEAKRRFWLVDSKGLITLDRGDRLAAHKVYFARDDNEGQQYRTLNEVIEAVKPTALVGLSSQPNVFTGEVIARMAELNRNPIIFPLSNPAVNAECDFATAMEHSEYRVIFASGTAFPPYTVPETGELRVPGQGNNMYIFPGLGLGAVLAQPSRITDSMIYESARALAGALTDEERGQGDLYPRIQRIRAVSAQVAAATIRCAVNEELATSEEVKAVVAAGDEALLDYVRSHMWEPVYSGPQCTGDASPAVKATTASPTTTTTSYHI
ncbi:hypothetical protein THASP1DRAFT_30219 [Thamnocephalis sphaerospora]|uniref:Malic enzyme n=1 Tax=Thamnocephalis sphaerospora TaxID=78915 RepID=A0A4P9XPM6_9FUNG|nr:hypothetical protein THASP1DRAFT_30219 [Thamnocephalis sphaerospora]|eukprot:RKP07964.1 hypothetical protein THASP1DRAFT_30219 [Thamnocephalis sphaerospora]